jgi:hypothetical protein
VSLIAMSGHRSGIGSAARSAAGPFILFLLAAVAFTTPVAGQEAGAVPAKVQQALDLLADPEVAAWIKANARTPEPAHAETPDAAETPWQFLSAWLESRQAKLRRMGEALPSLPDEIGRALGKLGADMAGRSFLQILVLVCAFVG